MTTVTGKVVRPITLTGYVDITGPEVKLVRWGGAVTSWSSTPT